MRRMKLAVNTAYAIAALVGFGAIATPASAMKAVVTCWSCAECHSTGDGGVSCSGCEVVAC
jgi:nitrate/TMAO reductase-like tetraheme cytochrome c subunit